ncbi:MAG: hypothetical protein MUF69_05045 [Desulfobacterota bacterium]|jgi:hypothetical protein|nr:hypothetical protein [Thermodesulfobacteriota bacterium]
MEPAQEGIIDLLEVVSEGKPLSSPVKDTPSGEVPPLGLTPEWEERIAELVREEVERLVRRAVAEEVPRLVREVLVQETEKALAREIERLKSA